MHAKKLHSVRGAKKSFETIDSKIFSVPEEKYFAVWHRKFCKAPTLIPPKFFEI
jgi:hypothetical protein